MKQDVFLSEVFLIISHSDVQTSWYEIIEEFTKKSLQDKDIDISFYNTLANFNTSIASLTNKIPLFLDSPNIDSLKYYFKAIESNQKVTNDFKFLSVQSVKPRPSGRGCKDWCFSTKYLHDS